MNKVFAQFSFTLLETVIAIAILGIGVAGMLQLGTAGVERVSRSQEEWRKFHMLSQAAEYFLLYAQEGEIDRDEIFPYRDYTASLTITDPEGLPETLEGVLSDCELKTYLVELKNLKNGQVIDQLKIDQLQFSGVSDGTNTRM